MKRIDTSLPGVCIVEPVVHGDHRGYFMETYSTKAFADIGIDAQFVQDNQSFTAQKGTLRGLHFQNAPMAQAKLVRVTRGAVLDVAVDLRKGSPTYRQWVGVELSATFPAALAMALSPSRTTWSSATRSITSTAGNATAACALTIPQSASTGASKIPSFRKRIRPRPCWRRATAILYTGRYKR